MNLKGLLILSIACLGPASALAQDGTKYKLEHKFKKGQKRQYTVSVNQRFTVDETAIIMTGKEVFVERCQSVDPSKKTASLDLEVKHLQLSRNRGGKLEEYDSKKKGSALKGLNKEATERLLETSTLPVNWNGAIKRRKIKVIGVDIFRPFLIAIENSPYDYLRFSDKAVKVGEQWSQSLTRSEKDPSNITSTFTTQFNFTLKSVTTKNGAQWATISFKTKTKISIMGEFDGPKFKKSEGIGTVVFNMTEGHLKNLDFSHKILLGEKSVEMTVLYKLKARFEEPKGSQN